MFVLFKQKTAYEMRISDWSSDVCSSALLSGVEPLRQAVRRGEVLCVDAGYQGVLAVVGERQRVSGVLGDLHRQDRAEDLFLHQLIVRPAAGRDGGARSEERRAGKECVSKCRSGW